MKTKDRLAEALEEAGHAEIAVRARQGYYDDFESRLALPKMTLVQTLRDVGDEAFAQRVIDGEFDNTGEEAEEWARSPEGVQTIEELQRGS